MSYDTSQDPRIRVAHRAITLFQHCARQKAHFPIKISKDKLAELISSCESAVMTLMYMYQEPQVLETSAPTTHLVQAADAFSDAYQSVLSDRNDQGLQRANIRWCLQIFRGLGKRFNNPGTSLASGIDIKVVQVKNVVRLNQFLITQVSDGSDTYAVVTNLPDIKSNACTAAAFLPPQEIGGSISEAMFLGAQSRAEPVGTFLSEHEVDAKEIKGILYEELKKST